ncbi:hypothetical protein [Neolewinella antarctica]|uniref:Tetratricopeptide repeat protein n=1 Tax=Neolewinella antarctica TaxID=442734 RepID=A0ABX0XFV6_9BACT|nr:hypothetical protein [Neolewinella antarctica]NJC27663.1 hypothetical protein [Neolewinella antarctica]
MRKLFSLLFLCLFTATSLTAGERYYDFNDRAQAIYTEIFALELDRAELDIQAFRRTNPTNLVAEHLESYLDFFQLYLSGNERLDARLESRFDRRHEALESGDDDDPFYRYALAENYLHRSLIDLRFERYLAAFRNLNRANKLLRDNAERFPAFLPNYKDLGVLHAAVGSIPPSYKWGVELFSSLNGTIAEGRREMQRALLDTESPFYLETTVVAAFVELHLAGNPERAYRMVNELALNPEASGLHCFVRANLAIYNGRNAEAIRILEAQPRGGTATDFPYLDFMLGLAKVRSLDPLARIHFQSFISRYAGRHFKEEARQKIAWSYLLQGDEQNYRKTILNINGGSNAGGDENAAREAAADRPPHVGLLRARLLFDGNYCTRARAQLNAIDQQTLTELEKLEFLYRTGRVYEGLKDYENALSFYGQTVTKGRDNPAYFACKSALQAGLVEEKRSNNQLAEEHFRTCLDISPAEYKAGLHTLANAGLSRVK